MKNRFSIAVLIALLAATFASAEVRLTLDDSKILPGTPTGVTVVVSDPRRGRAAAPARAVARRHR